jgi:hypothetical protein
MVMQDRLIVSLKALEGYLAFNRLLIMFVKEYPELLERANQIVRNFVEHEDNRYDISSTNSFCFLLFECLFSHFH